MHRIAGLTMEGADRCFARVAGLVWPVAPKKKGGRPKGSKKKKNEGEGEVAEEEGGVEKESGGGSKENEGGGREKRGPRFPEGTATEKDPEIKGRWKGGRLDPNLVKDLFSSEDDDDAANEDHNLNPPKLKAKAKLKTKPLGSSAAPNSFLTSIGGAAAASSAGQVLEPSQEISAVEKIVGMAKNKKKGAFKRLNRKKEGGVGQAEGALPSQGE
uniref:Uncharacterized protein n=1 Tax=Chromera velia CCMP2878 TaxID=1169474 RepID=A0A0G4GC93_9ALVE|eukprot:Cvel_21269.t1-p1 / transcript=Cvel_21269.t1 / gene=Cvel_21269 / organism=Chromera_velia_CCMP2878 / gene_product=hypothetical protein / transcript_product=hypothetical protein / location=Cvel_scaffold1979:15810-20804(-) / protein_length=213 / sequence_SO=supercontig / SO=protein_coding / is_pseudo=false